MTTFCAPRVLDASDNLDGFTCGTEAVDEWLAKRAQRAMAQGTAVVYVVFCGSSLAGFYSLSAHSVLREDVQGGWLRRNVPEQIPAVLLGMLGVDVRFQGRHVGSSLLRDAILRARHVSEEIGARALIVDPADEAAVTFYLKYGFKQLPGLDRMFLPLT